jgi:uncharacterized membrane protein
VYSIVLGASAEEFEPAQVALQAELTGSPSLVLTTIDQRNDVTVNAGETTEVKVLLVNSGMGSAANVVLEAVTPPGWEVTFDQNPVESVRPNEALELTMTVKPSGDAEGGDYNVDVSGSVPESATDFRFRVTVERSSAFGFIGIAVIVLLVTGLGALMVRLGRR